MIEIARKRYSTDYVRPSDWLPLPSIGASEQKFVGLHAVWPDSNFLALKAVGAYTVNWGDGLTENFATGATAEHTYDYDDVDLAGTESSRGYKQAIVTVTPQAGQTLTCLYLHVKHSQVGLQKYSSGFLDIAVNAPSMTTLTIGVQTPGINTQTIHMGILESVTLGANSVTNFNRIFYKCASLQAIPALNTAAGTTFDCMFSFCASLQTIPAFDIAAGTNFTSMFNGCTSLQTIPALNTAACTNFSYMFYNCTSLQTIPAFDIAAGTNFDSMFNGCTSLSNCDVTGTGYNISYNNCKLSAARLNEIYTNLATVTGKTITVTGNYGTTGDNPALAQDKGWTVTG